jgi:drug/metabolite transporter (DMT)-like permease
MITVYFAAALAAILWGTSFLLTRITMTQLGPMAVAALRWWITSLLLVGIVALSARNRRNFAAALRSEWRLFLALGIIGEGAAYIMQNMALIYTTTIDVGLIMNAYPILSAALGVWVLGEHITRRAVVGLVLALLGVTLINLGGLLAPGSIAHDRLLGNVLALAATLAGAFYIVAGKRVVSTYGPLAVSALGGAIGALSLTPAAAWEGIPLHWSLDVWGALLGLAIGSGAAAYWLWWYAARQLPISQAGIFLYITPVVSTLLGMLVLSEPLTVATAAGAGFVLGGVLLVQA